MNKYYTLVIVSANSTLMPLLHKAGARYASFKDTPHSSNLMTRIFTLFLLSALTSCVSSKKYQRQEIIEQKVDSMGRIVSKTYHQWISNPSHNKLATITQLYDTLGRIVKEYGFDNPYTYDRNYLIEKIYKGTYIYLANKYIWNKVTINDSAFAYNIDKFDSTLEMFQQNIYPDSSKKNKEITISLSSKGNSLYYGQFQETFPNTESSWTSYLYSFEVTTENIFLDSNRKLILTNIRKK